MENIENKNSLKSDVSTQNSGMKVCDIKQHALTILSPLYGNREAEWIVRAIFECVMGWKPVDMVFKMQYEMNPYTVDRIKEMVERVAAGEPVQYVTGFAPFYGNEFKVQPGVLIPRPETAELVDMIVKDWSGKNDLTVLDCGTGSGCIAVSLARNLPFAKVTGIDVSPTAISVAQENARLLKVSVNIEKVDILTLDKNAETGKWDIIVSNPPYVLENEKPGIEKHVTDYEPSLALFVPDNDPLKFYRPIARYALEALRPGGKLYFEINPLCVKLMLQLLKDFDDVSVVRDSQGFERFVVAEKEK
ncbi:MAG: peptide chain release factor N(5)-glutamine methyltransferase [Muribaculaceae bacterium]|nr:peptide chain release factor N(5)-glutamine methyltransferase [Muribaculaceae bacterium]